jgi:hypothetical protein
VIDEQLIHEKYSLMNPDVNERSRRRWSAIEAQALGRGGISAVSRATGITRKTIRAGLLELKSTPVENTRIRKKGGGRKKLNDKDSTLEDDLNKLVEPTTRGDPESPLRYTIKSTRNLMKELKHLGHVVSYPTVAKLLHKNEYSLQANNKTTEGKQHPDRNAQFEYINQDVKKQLLSREPVISVDTKKKELVGNFKNNGREWCPKGQPRNVNMHDFADEKLGKVIPYGVYEIDRNHGWVNLGIDHDTAEFAVESIRRWWKKTGKRKYPRAKKLTVTADSGGSNSSRTRLWKFELQRFSNETGLAIRVRHFPPGTSKWNKIEHRLFSFISQNWKGKPLISRVVIINLITATKTDTGLKVECVLDTNKYATGLKISDEDFAKINLVRDSFHGDWNYIIKPIE